jgi:hypothetical protein
MEKRLTLVCWNCSKKYTLLCDFEKETTLIVTCPFCTKEASVDLAAYRKEAKTVFSGSGGSPARLAGDLSTDAPAPDISIKKKKKRKGN